jgi:hypothetical protein
MSAMRRLVWLEYSGLRMFPPRRLFIFRLQFATGKEPHMPVRLQRKEIGATPFEPDQVCARGWQDYMIAISHFQFEEAVAISLRDLAPKLRRHLGLPEIAEEVGVYEMKMAA